MCNKPFYIKNWSIHGLWYSRWVLNPSPSDTKGQLKNTRSLFKRAPFLSSCYFLFCKISQPPVFPSPSST